MHIRQNILWVLALTPFTPADHIFVWSRRYSRSVVDIRVYATLLVTILVRGVFGNAHSPSSVGRLVKRLLNSTSRNQCTAQSNPTYFWVKSGQRSGRTPRTPGLNKLDETTVLFWSVITIPFNSRIAVLTRTTVGASVRVCRISHRFLL